MSPEQPEHQFQHSEQPPVSQPSAPPNDPVSSPVMPSASQPLAGGQQVAGQPYQPQGYQVYTAQPPQAPRSSKRLIAAAGVVLGVLMLGAGALLWHHKTRPTSTPAANSTSKSKTPSARTTPVPQLTSGTAATLGVGTFVVGPGKDVTPGLYGISPGPQQSGTFAITSPTGNLSVILDNIAADPYGTNTAWALLATGDKLQISGDRIKTVAFTPVPIAPSDPPILSKLYNGSFNVSASASGGITPGKRLATSDPNTTGDVLVISKDYRIKYSQTLNSTGSVLDLAEGDRVAIAGLNRISFGRTQ